MQCISLPELDIFLLCVASCALFAVIYVKIKNYKKPKEADTSNTSEENIIEFVEEKNISPVEEHKIEFVEDRKADGSVYYSTNHNGKCVPGSLSQGRKVAYRIYESYVKSVNNKEAFLGKKVIESTTVKRPI